MARHLMAVCVVCILCVKHVPCKEHFENLTKNHLNNEKIELENSYEKLNYNDKIEKNASTAAITNTILNSTTSINNDDTIKKIDDFYNNNRSNNHKDYTKMYDNHNDYEKITFRNRKKRHSSTIVSEHNDELDLFKNGHHYHQITTTDFLKKLFQQYGNDDGQTMNVDGFETMLHRLGLYNLIESKISKNHNNNDGNIFKQTQSSSFSSLSSTSTSESQCISSLDLISRMLPNKQQQQHSDHHHNHKREKSQLMKNNQ